MNEQNLPATSDDHELPDLIATLAPRKRLMISALRSTFGNITQSCQVAGVGRRTYYQWMATDEAFKQIVESEEFEEQLLDFAEHKLKNLINDNNVIATIFFLKTKGKKRGYIERSEVDHGIMNPDKKPSWFDPKQLPSIPQQEGESYITEAEVISTTTKSDDNAKAAEL